MAAFQIAPWRLIPGTGRAITAGSGSNTTDTVKMGNQTYACLISVTSFPVVITIQHGGVAATASSDLLINNGVAPVLLACAPGDQVSAWGIGGAGVAYVCEVGH